MGMEIIKFKHKQKPHSFRRHLLCIYFSRVKSTHTHLFKLGSNGCGLFHCVNTLYWMLPYLHAVSHWCWFRANANECVCVCFHQTAYFNAGEPHKKISLNIHPKLLPIVWHCEEDKRHQHAPQYAANQRWVLSCWYC